MATVVVGGPLAGGVAFCGCEGGEGVDVDAGGEEEDTVDCVGGEGEGRGHCWVRGCETRDGVT